MTGFHIATLRLTPCLEQLPLISVDINDPLTAAGRLLLPTPIPTPCSLSSLLWRLLLKQWPKSGAAATAVEPDLPSISEHHCHGFIFRDHGDGKICFPGSDFITWQPSPATFPSSIPEGAADGGGPGCNEAMGSLSLVGVEGGGVRLSGTGCWERVTGVQLPVLGWKLSRQ